MSTVYGEVAPSGQDILVTVASDDIGLSQAAGVLRALTAAVTPTQDPNTYSLPLTWTTVTQLAHGFPGGVQWDGRPGLRWVPGPALCDWMIAEIIRRSCEGDFTGEMPVREPMAHQRAGAVAIGMNGRFLLADDMGTGKTLTYLMGLAELEARGRSPWPALLVTPASVIDTVLEEIPAFYPGWKAAAYRGANRQRYLRSDARILVMGYETMRNDTGTDKKKGALTWKYHPGAVVYDECVPHDTMIETNYGMRPIWGVSRGDFVRGADHASGQQVWTRVRRVARSPLRATVRIDQLHLTANHPVWVADWRPSYTAYAASYAEGFHLLPLRQAVSGTGLPEQAGTEVLLPGVREQGEGPAPEDRRSGSAYVPAVRPGVLGAGESASQDVLEVVRDNTAAAGGPLVHRKRQAKRGSPADRGEESRVAEDARVPDLSQEPVQRAGRGSTPHEGSCGTGCGWVAGAYGGQWHGAYYPAGTVVEAARRGVHPGVLHRAKEGAGLPDEVLRGPGVPSGQTDRRVGRAVAQGEGTAGAGPEARYETGLTWLDDTQVSERDRPERSLWNLETDTGNYVAAGVLVHNCHSLCNFDSLQSRAARRLALHAPNVIAGSGTPITKNAAGFWPVLNAMYPRSYPSRERFKARYFLVRGKSQYGNGDADVTGLDPLREPEFRITMQGVYRRVALDDVVDMPPKTYQARYVDIPPAWRAAYDQMEEDMLAELPDQMTPLEANVAIVKMMRLRQLACSACDVKVTRETEQNPRSPRFGEEVEHTEVTLKEPCWKGAALVDLLDEMHQGEGVHDELGRRRGHETGSRPVLAFAEFSQLTRLSGLMAEKAGYATGYIDGAVKPAARSEVRHAFQEGQLDLLCVTTGTGGVGLNLTAARDVVFLARPWAYVPAIQSERRAWRRGQDKPVTIYDLVARNSVESRIFARLRDKAVSLADLVQDKRIAEEFLGGTRH